MIGIDDVFEARIAASRQYLVRAPEDRFLDGRVLDHGLDQQVGWDDLIDRRDAAEHFVRVGAALLGEPLQALAHRSEAALRRAGCGVVERDATAGGRDDLRDAAAHLARPDDKNVRELHTSTLA